MSIILQDVKHQLGLLPNDTAFDTTIIIHINTIMMNLSQLGAIPEIGFELVTGEETWDELFADQRLNAIKSYMYLRVKLLFDPPPTGFVLSSLDRQILELEWRLNAEVDF